MKSFGLLLILLLHLSAKSQLVSSSVTNSAGNSFTNGVYSFDWSVGEAAIVEPMQASNGLIVLTNGLLQPNIPKTIPVLSFTDSEIKISPNPTYNYIDIKLTTFHKGDLIINVYDAGGKLLYSTKKMYGGIPDSEKIDLSTNVAGTYLLKIFLDPKPGSLPKTGSYKIIKI